MQPQSQPRQSGLAVAAFVVALVAHLAIGVPLLSLGLVAPLWAIVIFWLLWGFMLWVLLRLRRRRPLLTLPVPIVTAAAVIGGLTLGGELLGWTP
jgi:hypothetical protein